VQKCVTDGFSKGKRMSRANRCESLQLFATSHYFRTQAGLTEAR
jgi:hypothetical protein